MQADSPAPLPEMTVEPAKVPAEITGTSGVALGVAVAVGTGVAVTVGVTDGVSVCVGVGVGVGVFAGSGGSRGSPVARVQRLSAVTFEAETQAMVGWLASSVPPLSSQAAPS